MEEEKMQKFVEKAFKEEHQEESGITELPYSGENKHIIVEV